VSDKDLFLAALACGPMLKADAIVVLCGEDADARVRMASGLFLSGAAPKVVLSGGKHEPPRWIGAEQSAALLYGKGVAPDRVILDTTSQNTRDQAVAIARMACDYGWKRLILVASGYHAPRAHLTFLQALIDVGHDKTIHLTSVPASQSPWFSSPPGMTDTRAELLAGEFSKIDAYGFNGHVASYEQGVASLRYWEQGPEKAS
jgi:hypothetical protein